MAAPVGMYAKPEPGDFNYDPSTGLGFNISPLIPIWSKNITTGLGNFQNNIINRFNTPLQSMSTSNAVDGATKSPTKKKGLFNQGSNVPGNSTGVLDFLLNNSVYEQYK